MFLKLFFGLAAPIVHCKESLSWAEKIPPTRSGEASSIYHFNPKWPGDLGYRKFKHSINEKGLRVSLSLDMIEVSIGYNF